MAGVPVLGCRRVDGPPPQRTLRGPRGGGGRIRVGGSSLRGVGEEEGKLQRRPVCYRDDRAGGRLQVRGRLVQVPYCQLIG